MRKAKAKPDNTVNAILRAGQLVDGRYRVEHLIGEGGMAAVWAGTNERTGKRVALKVILRSLATTREAQRLFHSEALAASRVNHPNVVTVFDVIEHEGMPCIVMELLDGEPLGSYIAFRGFLTVSEATTVLLPAMRGVAAAHAQGVIHRDLKPQNIFICIGPDGRVVTTKVLDFGISVMMERVVDRSAGPSPALAMGTPAYMSPEHLRGSAHIDERSDVYGFGVLLYEALTGQMPFPGQPGPELFHRILNDPPPPLTLSRPDLSPGLVYIIEKAMAKKPGERYSNLNLLLGSIEDELAPATPAPRPITPGVGVPEYVAREQTSRNSAVQAVPQQEPSGQFPETQLFIAPVAEDRAPAFAARDSASARHEVFSGDSISPVQGIVQAEPSGQFPETQLFIAPLAEEESASGQFPETQLFIERPTEKEIPVLPLDGPADGGRAIGQSDDGLDDGLQAVALPWPTDSEVSPSARADSPITVPLSGLRSLAVFRDRRWLVGTGCAIALGVAAWMVVRSPAGGRKSAPARMAASAISKPVAPAPIPSAAPTATNPAVALPAPAPSNPAVALPAEAPTPVVPAVAIPTAEPVPLQPVVAASAPVGDVPAEPGALTAGGDREAKRNAGENPAAAKHHRHPSAKDGPPSRQHAARDLNPPPADTAVPAAKTAAQAPAAKVPRAGTLSADDF